MVVVYVVGLLFFLKLLFKLHLYITFFIIYFYNLVIIDTFRFSFLNYFASYLFHIHYV